MAHQEDYKPGMHHDFGMTPLTWWLAALAGSGMTLMITAIAIGVITGDGVGLLFVLGLLMLVAGGAAWFGVDRPFDNIDDINVPLYTGHSHDAHAEPEDDHSSELSHIEEEHAPVAHHEAMPVIPPRAPIGDSFGGALCVFRTPHPPIPTDAIYGVPTIRGEGEEDGTERYLLAVNPPQGAEVVARGVVIRYGARLLGKPFLSIVPGLIALERGEMMTGETAWDFLLKRSQLFPRAEVYGYTSEGKDEMKTVKWFDLALAPMVLAYADESASVPLAEVSALVGDAGDFPVRVVEYLQNLTPRPPLQR